MVHIEKYPKGFDHCPNFADVHTFFLVTTDILENFSSNMIEQLLLGVYSDKSAIHVLEIILILFRKRLT